jgi:ATP-dependent RNA helicase DDX49/DBP8
MAPPKTDKAELEDSDISDVSDVERSDVDDRAPKRRRLSESSNDSYVAPAPLPTLSRIKKKGEVVDEPESEKDEPVTIADAIELGRTSDHSTFSTLDVAPWLVASLSTMAIKRPTAIQKACIPEILKGKDCIGGSRTGSGKTMAFAVPIMQQWALNPFGIYALVLTPTRYVMLSLDPCR